MEIEFDPAKDALNREKHGISLARASEMTIFYFERDERRDYGEVRYRAWGRLDGGWCCLAFVQRNERLRAISLRRAHRKEVLKNVPEAYR